MAEYKVVRRRRDASMFWISRFCFWMGLGAMAAFAANQEWRRAVAEAAVVVLASWVLELGRAHRGW